MRCRTRWNIEKPPPPRKQRISSHVVNADKFDLLHAAHMSQSMHKHGQNKMHTVPTTTEDTKKTNKRITKGVIKYVSTTRHASWATLQLLHAVGFDSIMHTRRRRRCGAATLLNTKFPCTRHHIALTFSLSAREARMPPRICGIRVYAYQL